MHKKRIFAIVGLILLVFIITNPSLKSFKEHIVNYGSHPMSQENNFFIFSIYKFDQRRYIAIVGNFFYLKPVAPNHVAARSSPQGEPTMNMPGDIPFFSKDTKIEDTIITKGTIDQSLNDYIRTHPKH